MKVAERTSVLVTFGSPLDKIAYIFSLEGQHTSATREALAASAQPLIRDYAKYRRLQWINVYTPRDIIGGSLEFYDKQFDISTEFQEDLNIGVMSDALRTEFECRGFALSEQPKLKITSSALDESWNLCDEEHGTFIISRDRKSLHVCAEQRVKNVLDSDAMIPLIAHTELWKTKTTFTEFYQAFR